ncbi:MAG: c-type cytochrome [Salinarimonas sp.]
MMRRAASIASIAMLAATGVLAQDDIRAAVTPPADVSRFEAPPERLRATGERLFSDASLSTNGMSCATCHADFQSFNETFTEPYPHFVEMGQGVAGLDEVTAEQMVQLCMIVPMSADPLPWESEELAALTAHVVALREEFAAR